LFVSCSTYSNIVVFERPLEVDIISTDSDLKYHQSFCAFFCNSSGGESAWKTLVSISGQLCLIGSMFLDTQVSRILGEEGGLDCDGML
jgi:hypothetical protein